MQSFLLIQEGYLCCCGYYLLLSVKREEQSPKVNNANFSDDKEADGLNAVDDDEEPRRGEMDDG